MICFTDKASSSGAVSIGNLKVAYLDSDYIGRDRFKKREYVPDTSDSLENNGQNTQMTINPLHSERINKLVSLAFS